MLTGLEIPFDRITYRDGQLLASADMQADQMRNTRLRQLHTRYLHNTWGIAIGFEVSGNAGDSVVQVGPGYAIDLQGGELVLVQTAPIPVPPIIGPLLLVLTMSYAADSAFRERIDLDPLCLGGTADVRQEHPAFRWQQPDEVNMGEDVPLATVQVVNGTMQSAPDLRVRRYVQKLVRPYIAAGTTEAGRSGWSIGEDNTFNPFYFQVTVDTSDAGFSTTPFYFPVLHMPNGAPAEFYGVTNTEPGNDLADFGSPFAFMLNERQTSFDFHVFIPFTAPQPRPEDLGWTISWVGLELVEGCEPLFILLDIILRFPILFERFPALFQRLMVRL